jgi:hypothetical protein
MIPIGIQIVSGLRHISFAPTVAVGPATGEYEFSNMANSADNNQPAAQAVAVPGFNAGEQIVAVFWSPFDNIAALSSFRMIDVEQGNVSGQVLLTAWGYPNSDATIRIKITAVLEDTFISS